MPTKQINKSQPKYTIHKYTVVQFEHEDEEEKLFEWIPDRWFVDETKSSCFWPPMTGKSFSLRAINCEEPDNSWNICECRVISEGHMTYNSGYRIVREKCSQKYNTSSADEQINIAIYRRQHPVLAIQNDGSIEHIFSKPDPTSKKESHNKQHKNVKASSKKSSEENSLSVTFSSSCSLTDPRLVLSSSARRSESSKMETDIRKQNSHFETSGRDESENDLSLDCGNENICIESAVLVNGEKESTVTPQITSNNIEILVTDAAVHSSNQSPASQSRSIQRGSNGSRSSVSRSGGSRSSVSRSGGSRSSCSYLNRSRVRHVSSLNRSHSSSSGSNFSRPSRSDSSKSREHHSINESRRNRSLSNGHSSRSHSIESIRSDSNSIAENKSPQMQKHKENQSKIDLSSTNKRFKRIIKSNTNGSESNAKIKGSASGRPSKLSQSRRSRSIQSISSRSHSNSSFAFKIESLLVTLTIKNSTFWS